MKTKKELNQKMWFRALKIIYFAITLTIIIAIVVTMYVPYGVYVDQQKSYITCANGRKINGAELEKEHIYIYVNSQDLSVSDNDLEQINNVCLTKPNIN